MSVTKWYSRSVGPCLVTLVDTVGYRVGFLAVDGVARADPFEAQTQATLASVGDEHYGEICVLYTRVVYD